MSRIAILLAVSTLSAASVWAQERAAGLPERLTLPILLRLVAERSPRLAVEQVAIDTAEAFRRHLDDIFGEVDVLLTPSAAGEAPEGLGSTGDPSFNSIWTLAWTPCVTLPAGTGPSDLPLGVQLVGPRDGDARLLRTARWLANRLA